MKHSSRYERYAVLVEILRKSGEDGIEKGSEGSVDRSTLIWKLNNELSSLGYSEVSEPTLRLQDIVNLNEEYCNPVEIFKKPGRGNSTWYRLSDRSFKLGTTSISSKEKELLSHANAITKRLNSSVNWGDLHELLNNSAFAGEALLQYSKVVMKDFTEKNEGIELFQDLYDCCKEKMAIEVDYESFGKDIETFDFLPMLLKLYNRRWFCFGFRTSDLNRITKISLDRIDEFRRKEEIVIPFPEVNWRNYFSQMYGVTIPRGEEAVKYNVVVRFHKESAQYITTKPLHPKQVEKVNGDGSVQVTIPDIYLNFELERELFSRAPELTVIGPDVLKVKMIELANATLKNYK